MGGIKNLYSSKILVERIKSISKQKGFLLKDVLQANGLGVNALNQLSNKKGLSSLALAGIADYLDVSVDYLLGLTDIPDTKKAVGISADSPDDDTEKAIAYLNYLAQANPEALQKAAEYAKFLAQDNQ